VPERRPVQRLSTDTMQSLTKITEAKMRRRIGMYGDGCMIGALGEVESGEDARGEGLYGSLGTGWACTAIIMY